MNDNLFASGSEPSKGSPIYADTIAALIRASRNPQPGTTVAPVVVDDYIYLPLIISDAALKVRHKLLKLTSYDQDLEAWFAGPPDDDDPDANESLRSIFVVYQDDDYGILIGDKPVRVKVSSGSSISIADNLGGDHASSSTGIDRHGLLAVTQTVQDSVDGGWYCLVVRGAFDSRMVQCTFGSYANTDDELNGIATCTVVSSTVTGLIGQTIKVHDVDGAAFSDELEADLVGRLIGAVWMQYQYGDNYYFWRWEIWKISCPPVT